MKIVRNENGKLTIDGEHNTIVTPERGEDWVKIEGMEKENIELICNFIVIYPKKKERLI